MPQHTPEKGRQSTRYILTIDLGSGGHKAAVVADTGEVVASADETVTTFLLPDGGAEQDPEEWWSGAKKAAKKVIKESRVPPEDIVAVACDSQWSVVVPVDAHGAPLMRARSAGWTVQPNYHRRVSENTGLWSEQTVEMDSIDRNGADPFGGGFFGPRSVH